ncbi:OLC1v1001230C1 [Oldenlandia corymbosa var. corymbosa]|uniref:OLC1v1001230C1 n=1 Tax=Oldenlandia corymbosa var. corymbosa TaxID=529605 RepID=A0AAV1D7S2_OLDCO|nr:OLC1v1001230C1 [Oldenlandia corymbosa var. corymbosa]
MLSTDSSSYLPELCLFELLYRLSIREVLRFKCISKQCLSFLSDPSFYEEYYYRGLASPITFLLSEVQLVERHHSRRPEKQGWVYLTLSCERPVLISCSERPALLNTTFFYVDESETSGILAYDPYVNPHKLCIIELPTNHAGNDGSKTSHCGVSQERLKCFQIIGPDDAHQFKSLKIWELLDHDKWFLQHTIGTKDIELPSFDMGFQIQGVNKAKLASFHPFNPDVMYFYF